ncbi:MAG: glycosyltransferase family 2 protein [Candidatus Magnetoovum sp. WYHC-5]|nr:glycosyltransferase family 2 protein [Candidatus Magnetoovum sp. WYHC-5]
MLNVSVAIISKNEVLNIEAALESVKDAKEIVVVDDYSTDGTVNICKKYTQKIYQIQWQGYAKQKQMAIDLTSGQWVFLLDCDERLTPKLQLEIERVITENTFDGFYVPRKNFFLGKWIRGGGWWPDYTLRLFKKECAAMLERTVHERVIVNGTTGYLKNPIEHYSYKTVGDFITRMDKYSSLAAQEILKTKPSFSLIEITFTLTVKPVFTFIKMYIIRLGLVDGLYGLVLAILYSFYTFLKYLKLWELNGGYTHKGQDSK